MMNVAFLKMWTAIFHTPHRMHVPQLELDYA